MRSRLTTTFLVIALAAFGAGGAYTASAHLGKGHHKGHHHAKRHHKSHKRRHHKQNSQGQNQNSQGSNGDNSAQSQYGTRPGKGCGDRNHVHTGPPGNPSNTACPPQSRHSGTSGAQNTGWSLPGKRK